MKSTQDILNFFEVVSSGNTESAKRHITGIIPAQNTFPITQKRKLIEDAKEKHKNLYLTHDIFSDQLKHGNLDSNAKIAEVINTFAMFEFKRNNAYISDLHTGIYTMLTTGEKFLEIKPIYENNELKSIVVYTTLETIQRATFGPLVDYKGRAISGTGGIIHEAKQVLMPIIYGSAPMPRATASVNVRQKNGSYKTAWINGEPLHIYRTTKNLGNIIALELDTEFAPLKIEGNRILAADQYIHSVAGLTVFIQYGKLLTGRDEKEKSIHNTGIDSLVARRIITTIQTGCELGLITGFGVSRNKKGDRLDITINRNAIPDLVPQAVDSKGGIDWQTVSDAVSTAGKYYLRAMKGTGIFDYVQDKEIYIPATNKGAQFPSGDEYKNIVYLKAETARRTIKL